MKKSLTIILLTFLFVACNKPAGELVGMGAKESFNEAQPYGMVFIKRGSFMMGANDQSAIGAINDKSINVTVDAFWMDETEITNDKYKQFVVWVRDSIALRSLVMAGKDEYRMKFKNQTDDTSPESARLNWNAKSPWESKDEEVKQVLESFYYDGVKILGGKKQMNFNKLRYTYEWLNYDQAALPSNKFNVNTGAYPANAKVRVDSSYVDENGIIKNVTIERKLTSRRDLISSRIVNVYPDTIMWLRDFQFSYNDPKMRMYFSHPGFANYPVVGVTWEQCQAFCQWRTQLFNNAHVVGGQDYRLPTEAEWEYAARGGNKSLGYQYAGSQTLGDVAWYKDNSKGTTHEVGTKLPNEIGLFDMCGNVWEWCNDWYGEYSKSALINPKDPKSGEFRVYRGGGFTLDPILCRLGFRESSGIYSRDYQFGFRLCLSK